MPDTSTLTKRQQEVLEYIGTCIRDGCPPTMREMASHFGFRSPTGVLCHLDALIGKGFIVRDVGVSRGIRLADALRPEWRDRPTFPGLWLYESEETDRPHLGAIQLTQADIDRGAPYRVKRVYGPVPQDMTS